MLRLERQRLVVALPEGADPAAIRDGISARPPSATVGAGAWLLTQMIAAAPLAGWVTRFGLDAGQIVSLTVTGRLGVDVRAGWRLAAIRQGSREWAEALLAAGEPGATNARPPVAWPEDRQLAAMLPHGARTARAAALLAGPAPAAAVAEVVGCPGPWPDLLASAVMAALSAAVTSAARADRRAALAAATARHLPAAAIGHLPAATARHLPAAAAGPRPPVAGHLPDAAGHLPDAGVRQLLDAAAHHLPVTGRNDYAGTLVRLAATDNCPPRWSSALRRAADAVALRRAFVEEIR